MAQEGAGESKALALAPRKDGWRFRLRRCRKPSGTERGWKSRRPLGRSGGGFHFGLRGVGARPSRRMFAVTGLSLKRHGGPVEHRQCDGAEIAQGKLPQIMAIGGDTRL